MRKIISCILVLLSILSFSSCKEEHYTHGIYKIEITSRCVSNDCVGNDWSKRYTYNGKNIESGDKITEKFGSTITVVAIITEKDKYSDTGTAEIEIELNDKESESVYLEVEERNGRYDGNIAKWKVTVSVSLVKETKIKAD